MFVKGGLTGQILRAHAPKFEWGTELNKSGIQYLLHCRNMALLTLLKSAVPDRENMELILQKTPLC